MIITGMYGASKSFQVTSGCFAVGLGRQALGLTDIGRSFGALWELASYRFRTTSRVRLEGHHYQNVRCNHMLFWMSPTCGSTVRLSCMGKGDPDTYEL